MSSKNKHLKYEKANYQVYFRNKTHVKEGDYLRDLWRAKNAIENAKADITQILNTSFVNDVENKELLMQIAKVLCEAESLSSLVNKIKTSKPI